MQYSGMHGGGMQSLPNAVEGILCKARRVMRGRTCSVSSAPTLDSSLESGTWLVTMPVSCCAKASLLSWPLFTRVRVYPNPYRDLSSKGEPSHASCP